MSLIGFLIVGLIAGWIADMLVKSENFGLIGDLVVGIIGAFIGGFIFDLLGITAYGLVGNIVMSVIGAVVLLLLLRAVNRKKA